RSSGFLSWIIDAINSFIKRPWDPPCPPDGTPGGIGGRLRFGRFFSRPSYPSLYEPLVPLRRPASAPCPGVSLLKLCREIPPLMVLKKAISVANGFLYWLFASAYFGRRLGLPTQETSVKVPPVTPT